MKSYLDRVDLFFFLFYVSYFLAANVPPYCVAKQSFTG